MIRYALVCENGHEFDSWFPGSAAFDEQARRGLVQCALCPSIHVRKSIMAPSLSKGGAVGQAEGEALSEVKSDPPPAPTVMDERLVALRAMVRDMRTKIAEHTADVGSRFLEEARKMHYGEAEHRPIRGEAKPDDVRELLEEGVPILPVPMLPDERN